MDHPRAQHDDDLALVRAVLRGDSRALADFTERMRIASRILSARNARLSRPLGEAEIEDVCQDTLLSVWRRLDSYEGRASLETWVYSFCSFQLMSALRRRSRGDVPAEGLEDVPDREDAAPTPADDDAGFARYLRHLAPREAEVLRLRHVDQLTLTEVADALGISVSSVKTHYYRALTKLRAVQEAAP